MGSRTFATRMGGGSAVSMTEDELRRDVIEGSEVAAAKAKIPPLDEADIDYLVDMFACTSRIWGVERRRPATRNGWRPRRSA